MSNRSDSEARSKSDVLSDRRRDWQRPVVRRMETMDAENKLGKKGDDGQNNKHTS